MAAISYPVNNWWTKGVRFQYTLDECISKVVITPACSSQMMQAPVKQNIAPDAVMVQK